MATRTRITIILTLGLALAPVDGTAGDGDAGRIEKFAAMNGADKPARTFRVDVSLGTALSALAQATTGLEQPDRGDCESFKKTAWDYNRAACSLGNALGQLVTSMEPGPFSAAVAGMRSQLVAISWGGNGDLDYWTARATTICATVRAVGQQVNAMAASCGSNCPTVPAGAVLRGLAMVAASAHCGGGAEGAYWKQTTRNFCRIGQGVGRGVDLVARAVPVPLDGVLRGVAGQLTGLSSGDEGTSSCWMGRARSIAEQMHDLAKSLEQIAAGL